MGSENFNGQITCIICGKPTIAKVSWRKYCSAECRLAGYAMDKVNRRPDQKKIKITIDNNS